MPTKIGTIWAQWYDWKWVDGPFDVTHTVHPNHRDITAEAALTLVNYNNPSKTYWIETGISQIVSGGQTENFDPPEPAIMRNDVTSITFRTRASGWMLIRARHMIHYWE